MADKLQKYYTNKIRDIMNGLPRIRDNPLKLLDKTFARWKPNGKLPELKLREISRTEMMSLIKKLGTSTAFGSDFIDAVSIKQAAQILADPIKHVVNLSIKDSKFPNRWKTTRVILLYKGKKLDRQMSSSYRNISLVSTLAKLTEKAIQFQVIDYMNTNNYFNYSHHAYRPHYSTTTALLQLSDAILTATDDSLITTMVTIDESSALDCVSMDILVRKLDKYGFDEKTIEWFREYLTGR